MSLTTTTPDPSTHDRERISGQYLVNTVATEVLFSPDESRDAPAVLRNPSAVARVLVIAGDGYLWWPRAAALALVRVGDWDTQFRASLVG